MTVATSLMDHALRIPFLFILAALFAAVEIEIEGPHGWAERLPTWFRVTPVYARVYRLFMRGKPLTGYHLVMFALPLWAFHIGFAGGVPWSWPAEATTLAAYLVWVVVWDFLWFVFNPPFGWRRFRKHQVWWHDRTWIGRFPIDYYNALTTSFLVAASARLCTGDWTVVVNHAVLTAGLVALTAASSVLAPAYMRWYAHMRRPGADERPVVPSDPGD